MTTSAHRIKEIDHDIELEMVAAAKSSSASLPESISWRVSHSWNLVSGKAEEVGVDFFLRLFQEHPQAADLFRFGSSVMYRSGEGFQDANGKHLEVPKALKVHALKVMQAVGLCVGGLSHLPDLVPTLRTLGHMHGTLGVQDFHYDVVYKHLMDAIEAELGSEVFDTETREAWEIVYRSLTTVMKRPNDVLQIEPLEGWGVVNTVACAYLVIFSPMQMAGFTTSGTWLDFKLKLFTFLAALVLALDMASHWVAAQVRPKASSNLAGRSPLRREFDQFIFPVKYKAVRFLRGLQMDRWTKWHGMEALVLLSFPLQYMSQVLFPDTAGTLGVHWSYMFGLLRLAAASRVTHSIGCAENNLLLRQQQDQQQLSFIRMVKLIATMLVVIHINACIWCIVARVELGAGALVALPSSFFPKYEIFGGQMNAINAYLHAVHWAWVSLAGIGECDSEPETSLECLTTLFVHICGATLYTITTGNVVAILETMAEKRNETGTDLADLGRFMQSCSVPQDVQKRIMQGYMMRQMVDSNGGMNNNEAKDKAPDSPEAVSRLPGHLRQEMATYTRAEAIRRREPAFSHCSHEFLVSFVVGLHDTTIVLPEDYYVREGKPLPPKVALLVDGTLDVMENGSVVKQLQPGDVINTKWLLQERRMPRKANPGLRADTTCTLITGFDRVSDLYALKDRFAKDFSLLAADGRALTKEASMRMLQIKKSAAGAAA